MLVAGKFGPDVKFLLSNPKLRCCRDGPPLSRSEEVDDFDCRGPTGPGVEVSCGNDNQELMWI